MTRALAIPAVAAAALLAACIIREPAPDPPIVGQYGAGPPQGAYPEEQSGQYGPPGQAAEPGYGQPGHGQATGRTGFQLSCDFPDGWIAVVPAELYDPNDEFAMQALIGFATEPDFWYQQADYAKYGPHAAQQCATQPLFIDHQPGEYIILVGWAGRGDYRQNGHLQQVTLQPGGLVVRAFRNHDLDHDWPCISCPFLAVWRGGRPVELGNVLVDRYSAARAGTDVVRAQAEVRGGRVTVTLSEREPEISRIDAVEVEAAGRVLAPAPGSPPALRAADGDALLLSRGDSVDLAFVAGDLPEGLIDVEIRITGWYQPMAPLR